MRTAARDKEWMMCIRQGGAVLNPLRRDRQYCVSDGEQLAARRLLFPTSRPHILSAPSAPALVQSSQESGLRVPKSQILNINNRDFASLMI
jgi:hypothetical protein